MSRVIELPPMPFLSACFQWSQEPPDPLPWDIIAPHEAQAQENRSQTLKRLRERGGLAPDEMLAILEDRRWRWMDQVEALNRIAEIVRAATADLDRRDDTTAFDGGRLG